MPNDTPVQFSVRLPLDLVTWIDAAVAAPTSPYGTRTDYLRHLVKRARHGDVGEPTAIVTNEGSYEAFGYAENGEDSLRFAIEHALARASNDQCGLRINVYSRSVGIRHSRLEQQREVDSQVSPTAITALIRQGLDQSPGEGFKGQIRIQFSQAGVGGTVYGHYTRQIPKGTQEPEGEFSEIEAPQTKAFPHTDRDRFDAEPRYDYFPLFTDPSASRPICEPAPYPGQEGTIFAVTADDLHGSVRPLTTSPFDTARGSTRVVGLRVHIFTGPKEAVLVDEFKVGGCADLLPIGGGFPMSSFNESSQPDRRILKDTPILHHTNAALVRVRCILPATFRAWVVVDRNLHSTLF